MHEWRMAGRSIAIALDGAGINQIFSFLRSDAHDKENQARSHPSYGNLDQMSQSNFATSSLIQSSTWRRGYWPEVLIFVF